MKTTTIETGSIADFFEQGQAIARLIDQKLPLPEISNISFADPEDFLELLKEDNLLLFRAIKEQPDSITNLATRLRRDAEAVQRDVRTFNDLGIVAIEHGEVRLTAERFKLAAELL